MKSVKIFLVTKFIFMFKKLVNINKILLVISLFLFGSVASAEDLTKIPDWGCEVEFSQGDFSGSKPPMKGDHLYINLNNLPKKNEKFIFKLIGLRPYINYDAPQVSFRPSIKVRRRQQMDNDNAISPYILLTNDFKVVNENSQKIRWISEDEGNKRKLTLELEQTDNILRVFQYDLYLVEEFKADNDYSIASMAYLVCEERKTFDLLTHEKGESK